MNTHTTNPRILWILPVILAVMASAAPLSTVQASPPADEGKTLESLYQRELELLSSQEERLQKAAEAASRVEDYIAGQQAKAQTLRKLKGL